MNKLTVRELAGMLQATVICEGSDTVAENGYCGDFLSFVISRAPEKAVWFTVMNNANVAAVAKLADIPVIVICEGIKADERLIECCNQENIALLQTDFTSFECAVKVGV